MLAAATPDSPCAAHSLEQLCRAYWHPLYAYVRRKGHNPEDAQDLTQQFFARLLQDNRLALADQSRGRFRTFLLSALQNFLINEWTKTGRQKRGAGIEFVPLHTEDPDNPYAAEPMDGRTPETIYEERWAAACFECFISTGFENRAYLGSRLRTFPAEPQYTTLKRASFSTRSLILLLNAGMCVRNKQRKNGRVGIRMGHSSCGILLAILLSTFFVIRIAALEVLHLFDSPAYQRAVSPLLSGADGSFYGVAGGPPVILYQFTGEGLFSVIGIFDPSMSRGPANLFTNKQGRLHGVFSDGGESGHGCVFRREDDGQLRLLASLNLSANGAFPRGAFLQASDGNFYGTTVRGGAFDVGALLKLTPDGLLTRVASFEFESGSYPIGNLVENIDGALYGVCHQGGAHRKGAVFKFVPGGQLSTVLSFDGADGSFPLAGLILGRDGNFYGTTAEIDIVDDSLYGEGTVFRLTSAGLIQTVARFDPPPPWYPRASLVQTPDGLLHGTLSDLDDDDDTGNGGIFSVDPRNGSVDIVRLDFDPGRWPIHPLVQSPDGALLTLAQSGGEYGSGGILKIGPDRQITNVHSFKQLSDPPRFPLSGVALTPDGHLFGTTVYGGNGYGTVYRYAADGVFAQLHAFNQSDGDRPEAALTLFSDGNFYGTTLQGGRSNLGTIFRISPAGEFRSLASFEGSGGSMPASELVEGSDGLIYGVTLSGSDPFIGGGVVFRATRDGAITVLLGMADLGGVIQRDSAFFLGKTGVFFGTAITDDKSGFVYEMTADGVVNNIQFFGLEDGGPPGPMVQAPDGTLYGITFGRLPHAPPVLFKLVRGEAPITLAVSDLAQGVFPSRLIVGRDGAIYSTFEDGQLGDGSLFQLTPDGAFRMLHSFYSPRYPSGALAGGPDGSIYGVASSGGRGGGGIFRLATPAWLTAAVSGNQVVLTWSALYDNFKPESSSAPQGQPWHRLSETPARTGENLSLTLPLTPQAAFFRLVRP